MPDAGESTEHQVDLVRDFNRFYTKHLGLLAEGLLASPYSLTEARVLFELATRPGRTASEIGRELGLDAGYLSRVLKRFEVAGLVARGQAGRDGRQVLLTLTATGTAAFAGLNAASHDQVAAMLGRMTPDERARLVQAMRTVQRLLGGLPAPPVPYLLRPHQPGDLGWIIHRHAVLYTREYGWDASFETLVADIATGFAKSFDPAWARCWIAEREDAIVGSVAVMRDSAELAKLRLLYVEPEARGLGIGRRLVAEAIRFARDRGYRALTLWTNDILVAARHLYESFGFRLLAEEPGRRFGKDLVGQHWRLDF